LNSVAIKNRVLESVDSKENVILINECIKSSKENEALFFLKPEFFGIEKIEQVELMLSMIMDKIKEFDIDISGVLTLKGDFLKEAKIIERHYGFINRMSTHGSKLLTDLDLEKIKQVLSVPSLEDYKIFGGHELVKAYDDIDEQRVTDMWYKKVSYRIGEGFYIQVHDIKGEKVIIINGFNPHQIKHFTSTDSKIVLFLLQTDTDWFTLRNTFVGDTYPENAFEGSIRNLLFKDSAKYGIKAISVADNFVHASSGPFDSLFEICNFVSNIKGINFSRKNTNIYYLMKEKYGLGDTEFNKALDNPVAEINGQKTDLFTFTKNRNTFESVADYVKYFKDAV
jgi:hypothetical protein